MIEIDKNYIKNLIKIFHENNYSIMSIILEIY